MSEESIQSETEKCLKNEPKGLKKTIKNSPSNKVITQVIT